MYNITTIGCTYKALQQNTESRPIMREFTTISILVIAEDGQINMQLSLLTIRYYTTYALRQGYDAQI